MKDQLIFITPTTLPVVLNKPPATAGRPYPISDIGDTDFANLIYWLYRTEIRYDDSWKRDFDNILQMQATRDKGRDCSLQKNGVQCGVIQCKHSANKERLSWPEFVKEVVKFVLYSFVYSQDIKISQDFPYYIASSGGFTEDCLENINNFANKVGSEPKLKKWTEGVIKAGASIDVKYDDIDVDLLKRLQTLKIHPIGDNDIKLLLDKSYQTDVKTSFFELKGYIDKEALKPLQATLNELKQRSDRQEESEKAMAEQRRKRPAPIAEPDGYLPRYVFNDKDEMSVKMLSLHKTILDYMGQSQHIALLGWGQTGKSFELQHLGHILSGPKYDYHVYQVKLDVYSDQDISSYIPDIAFLPKEKIILLLDGLDEVLQEFYGMAIKKIHAFGVAFPKVRMIISCRQNFYETFASANILNTLPDFLPLTLMELDHDTTKKYLEELPNMDAVGFYNAIRLSDLSGLIKTPFYLIRFAQKFVGAGKLYSGKNELFEEMINDGIRADVARHHVTDHKSLEDKLRVALEKLSFILEMQGKNYFKLAELDQIFKDSETVKLIKEAGRLVYGETRPDGYWRFIHHNIQEYLAAKVLCGLEIADIKSIITKDPAASIVKPGWIHTISFLINLLDKQDARRNGIIDLLIKNEPGLFLKFEPDKLSDEIRSLIFQRIFDYYKTEDKRLNRTKFDYAELAAFCQNRKSVELILNILESQDTENQVMNALEITSHYQLKSFPDLKARFKNALTILLSNPSEDIQYQSMIALNSALSLKPAEFKQNFDQFKFSQSTWLRSALFQGIWRRNLAAVYLEFLLDVIKKIILVEKNRGYMEESEHRLGDEDIYLLAALKTLKRKGSFIKLIEFWGNYISPLHYSIHFRELLPWILEQVGKTDDNEYYHLILNIFVSNSSNFYNHYRIDELVKYFKKIGKEFGVFKSLCTAKSPLQYTDMKIMSPFYNDEAKQFIIQEIVNGNISQKEVEVFQLVLNEDHKERVPEFNQIVNLHLTMAMPIEVDWTSNRSQELIRESATLFNLQAYEKEIESLYHAAGKDFISWDQLHYFDQSDKVESAVRYWVFDNFQTISNPNYQFDKHQVLKDVILEWDLRWAPRLYRFAKNNIDWEPDPKQRLLIVEWVETMLSNIDFTNVDLSWTSQRDEENNEAIIASFLIRQFHINELEEDIYLDMLSMQRWTDSAPEIFEFVKTVVPLPAIEEKVLQNLYERKLDPQALKNHLNFVSENQITSAAPLLIPYLADNGTHEWDNVLMIFRSLDGDLKELQSIFPGLDQYNHNRLVVAFIEEKNIFIETYLENRLAGQSDPKERLTTAKFLIRLQKRAGLAEYYEYMKREKKVPDISAPGNPLYEIRDLSLLDLVFQLLILAYDPSLKYDVITNPRSIVTVMLRNMAFTDTAFLIFKKQIDQFITDQKNEQFAVFTKERQTMLDELEYFYEGLLHSYSLIDEAPINLSDAIGFTDILLKNDK
jgi:hypothetical protein